MEIPVSHWLRRIGYGLAGVVSLLVLAVAVLYAITSSDLRRRYRLPGVPVPAATDSSSLARGKHLVEVIGKCQECHGEDYGGKVMVDAPMFGRLAGRNLTRGRGGIGDYNDEDWERAIRHGVAKDGRPLIFMPSEAYTVMGDAELAAVVGYLRTRPPVDRETPAPRVGPIARALYLGGNFPLLAVKVIDHDSTRRPPVPGVSLEYGKYLATLGVCRSCHGSDLAGTGDPAAPDLTRSRLAAWTEADFFRSLRQGQRPDGSVVDPEKMPWLRSGRMTDDEIRAVWLYIRSLPGRRTT